MKPFAHNLHLDQLKPLEQDNSTLSFGSEKVGDHTFTIAKTMFQDYDFMKTHLGQETRGSVFNEAGECVSRPFHKFFNYGQIAETTDEGIAKYFKDANYEFFIEKCFKEDGSMIHTVIIDGKVKVKTKKSFYSDVAKDAQKYMDAHPMLQEFCKREHQLGYTPIFEYVGPGPRKNILDVYEKEEFVYLCSRGVERGNYLVLSQESCMNVKGMRPAKWFCEENLFYSVDEVLDYLKTQKAVVDKMEDGRSTEGFVFRIVGVRVSGENEEKEFHYDHEMWLKMKSPAYLALHRLLDLRERDVALSVVDEIYDDMIVDVDQEYKPACEEIRELVNSQLTSISLSVTAYAEKIKSTFGKENFKEAALFMKTENPDFLGIVMNVLRGKDIEDQCKSFWMSHYFKQWSLNSITKREVESDD